jgi:type III secretion system chaperone SycN
MMPPPWVASALDQFANSIGLPRLALGDDASVTFELNDRREFTLQVLAEEVLVVLSTPLPHFAADILVQAMRVAGEQVRSRWTTQIGLTRAQALVVIIRVPARQFDSTTIDAARAHAESVTNDVFSKR